MEEAAPSIEPAAVELDVEGKIGGVKVLGKVDLIDTDGRVVDVKTSARRPSGIAPDYAFQLATYRQIAPGANGEARLNTLVKTKTVPAHPAILSGGRSGSEGNPRPVPVGPGGNPERALLSKSAIDAVQPTELRVLATMRARIRRDGRRILTLNRGRLI